ELLNTTTHYWNRYLQRAEEDAQLQRISPELIEYRWLVEELRVSLFAQHLGTRVKVSPQRIEKQWDRV
ncbi:MAG: DUF3418 domain-containing protein, partial [Planctomycetales bacterium]|nr:DUF3418 domain-containing protein [Planctomycetales bacterium]